MSDDRIEFAARTENDSAKGTSVSGFGIAVNHAGHRIAIIAATREAAMAAATKFVGQAAIRWNNDRIIPVKLFKGVDPVDDDPYGIGDPFA